MASPSTVLGPDTAVALLDPNDPWVYAATLPLPDGTFRVVYVGQTVQHLAGRTINNRSESFKGSAWLRYCRGLFARGARPDVRYLPFHREADAIAAYGHDDLLNEAPAGGGRKPTVTWTPVHVDAVLSGRTNTDLALEFGIGAHHWKRLRHRYREVQDPSRWLSPGEIRHWPIGDLKV